MTYEPIAFCQRENAAMYAHGSAGTTYVHFGLKASGGGVDDAEVVVRVLLPALPDGNRLLFFVLLTAVLALISGQSGSRPRRRSLGQIVLAVAGIKQENARHMTRLHLANAAEDAVDVRFVHRFVIRSHHALVEPVSRHRHKETVVGLDRLIGQRRLQLLSLAR